LECELKPWKKVHKILDDICKIYTKDKITENTKDNKLDRPKSNYFFITDDLVTVKFIPEDVQARRNSAIVYIEPILGKAGKATLQIFPKGTINLSYIDALGQILGLEVVSWICKSYSIRRARETPEENIVILESLRKQIKKLVLQREKAIQIIAGHLKKTKKITKKQAIEEARKCIGVPTAPTLSRKDKRRLATAKKAMEEAYRKTRK
jgi:hypothetical protein